MKNTKWMVIAIVLLVIAFALYRTRRSGSELNVEPHAREEIEKARRR